MAELLILGVIVSIVFYELTDITPGGLIVPGIMVAHIGQPLRMVYTLLIAIAAYYIVKLLSRRFLIFGKRRFVLLIVISLVLHVFFNLRFGAFTLNFGAIAISVVGYTVSGIIANNMFKQGVVKTSLSLAVVVCIIELVVILLSAMGVAL